MIIQEEKKKLRAAFLAKRRAMSAREHHEKSEAICERVARLPVFKEDRPLLCYVSSMDNEADTQRLIAQALAEGRRVLTPASNRDRTMTWCEVRSLSELAPSRFGVLEPDRANAAPAPPEGLAIVPGLAFTLQGDRLGYGAGYYDRFLAAHGGPHCAIAFELQIAEALPREPHDVRLECIVTERRLCGSSPPSAAD
jgi:5-formyltetrahydrofolate cyclo-ligase